MDESSDQFPATVAEHSWRDGALMQSECLEELERSRLAPELRKLLQENRALRAENTTLHQLCRDYLSAKQRLDRLTSFVEDVFGRGVWDVIKKAKRARLSLRREGTVSARLWQAGTRVLKRTIRIATRTASMLRAASRSARQPSRLTQSAESGSGNRAGEADSQ